MIANSYRFALSLKHKESKSTSPHSRRMTSQAFNTLAA